MYWQDVRRIVKSDYPKLLLILALAFYLALIPHQSHPYAIHLDEWIHMAHANEIISNGTIIGLTNPFTGEGMTGNQVFETGYHLLLAIFYKITGIPWLIIIRYGPAVIFMGTVITVYLMGKKQGYGLEAAFFTALIPTTIGILGPGFLVPIALGLLLIPPALLLAYYYRTLWSYGLLFLLFAFMITMHPPTAICLALVLIPFIALNLKGNVKRSLIIGFTIAFLFIVPFPWISEQLLPTIRSLLSPQDLPRHVLIPRLLEVYGYLPIVLCLLGAFVLSLKREKENFSLVLGLFLLLAMLATFYTLHYGQSFVYYRGLMVAMLIMGIVAGAGLHWLRELKLPEAIIRRIKMPPITRKVGYVLYLIIVVITLSTVIPVRQNSYYYHLIDETDFQAFVWIRDNVDDSYQKAIMDPLKAVPFTAITGKYTHAQVFGTPTPNSGEAKIYLREGCKDTAFLKENGISVVYTLAECNNPDLIEVRDNVYILRDGASE